MWFYVDSGGWGVCFGLDGNDWSRPAVYGFLPLPWQYGSWVTLRLVIKGTRAIGMYYQKPASEADANNATLMKMRDEARASWEAKHKLLQAEAKKAHGNSLRGGASGPLFVDSSKLGTMPMTLESGETVQAAVLFNADVSGAPTAGFAGLATGEFEDNVMFKNFKIAINKSTCDYTPVAGQPITVELCAGGAAGQAFSWVQVDNDQTHIMYYVFTGYDAESEWKMKKGG